MFSLVTLLDKSRADRYYVRHIFRTYSKFDRLFNLIDVRKYRAADNPADVTILDRFAMFAALYYEGVPYERLLDQFAGTRNLVLMTSDLHYWSLFPDLIDPELVRRKLDPSTNHYGRLFQMFDRLNIRHLITCYDCPELKQIQALRPELHTHIIELHIDPAFFRDYGLRKKYDVIIYGSRLPNAYPFRHRVAELLCQSRQLKVLCVETKRGLYDARICGQGLARKINRSWLGLSTISNFDYLVGKYFEISACRSVVLGNMNSQGRAIFGDHYVHIDNQMTDNQILEVVSEALADPRRLSEYADHLYEVMQTSYTLAENERKLFNLAAWIGRQVEEAQSAKVFRHGSVNQCLD
jgi:hypothetical protein